MAASISHLEETGNAAPPVDEVSRNGDANITEENSENFIVLKDVSKTFTVKGRSFGVIKNADLSIKKGDFVIFLGPSGCGKTTILNMISGLDRPSSGQIMVEGLDISRLKNNELSFWRANNVGIIFQAYNLLTYMSAVDNVAFPLVFQGVGRKVRREKAAALLKLVGLKERNHVDTNLLSGGEQQRVAIARSLIHHPKILIADEPTGDLDEVNASGVMEVIYNLYKKHQATILMSTHDSSYSRYADVIVYFQNGELVVKRKTR